MAKNKDWIYRKSIRNIAPWTAALGTIFVTLVGSGIISNTIHKWILLIIGIIISVLHIAYTERYQKRIEEITHEHQKQIEENNKNFKEELSEESSKIKENLITQTAKDLSFLTRDLSTEWTEDKALLFQNLVLDNIVSMFNMIGFKDVRASLYGITADEDSDNFSLFFMKSSRNIREPKQKEFTVDKNDPYGLFYVLEKNVPSQICRSEVKQTSSSPQIIGHTDNRHWNWSYRYPVNSSQEPTKIASVRNRLSDNREKFLLIIDTAENKKFPDYIIDISTLSSNLLLASNERAKSIAAKSFTRDDLNALDEILTKKKTINRGERVDKIIQK